MSSFSLVGGGVRSGKSRFALELAQGLGSSRTFIATAEAFDDEMRARILRHQQERAERFDTIECPTELVSIVQGLQAVDVVLIDCLTLWLSNLLLRGDDEPSIEASVQTLAEALGERRFHTVVVTNEVGMGVVPTSKLGRRFRDVAGKAHQRLAEQADAIYLATLGTVLQIRPRFAEIRR